MRIAFVLSLLSTLSACTTAAPCPAGETRIYRDGQDTTGTCQSTGSDSGDSATTDSGDTAATALTLANCATTVASDVPKFYQDFFRCADIAIDGDSVMIHTHDLPPHPSSYYPTTDPNWEAWDDRGGDYHQNPNTLSTQDSYVWVPLSPVAKGITVTSDMVDGFATTSTEEYNGGALGVGLDSVLLFAGFAAPNDDISQEQYTFDTWDGHPQETGVYHHHSPNPGALSVLVAEGLATTNVPGNAEIELYGIACDGTVILGCTELDGSTPDEGDFDGQNGHVADIVGPDATVYFTGRYHQHVCPGKYNDAYFAEIQYYTTCETR